MALLYSPFSMFPIDARAWPPMTDGIDVGDAEGTIKTPCRWSMDEYGIHDSIIYSVRFRVLLDGEKNMGIFGRLRNE